MKDLLKMSLMALFGVVLTYVGSYSVDQSTNYMSHYTSFCQMVFGILTVMYGFGLIGYSLYYMVENKNHEI